jgi:alanine racemase
MSHTEAVIDLSAIEANVAILADATFAQQTRAQVMAIVKADACGHGLIPTARAALAGGASWLGVSLIDEALALRSAGINNPIFASLWTPHDTDILQRAVAAGIDLSVCGPAQLDATRAAADEVGAMARIHLKVDIGRRRGGSTTADWPDLLSAMARAQADAEVEIVGVWSDFTYADEPDHRANDAQLQSFHDALQAAAWHGIVPQVRHIADSAATLTLPGTHFDLVRAGTAIYGLSPLPHRDDFGLVPAMTVRASLASAEHVGVGPGASVRDDPEATLAVAPLGYADGIPHGAAAIMIKGRRFATTHVDLDHFVVDVGDLPVADGEVAVLFGPGRDGEPRAQEWADATATTAAEIVTRVGTRVPRRYVGGTV